MTPHPGKPPKTTDALMRKIMIYGWAHTVYMDIAQRLDCPIYEAASEASLHYMQYLDSLECQDDVSSDLDPVDQIDTIE